MNIVKSKITFLVALVGLFGGLFWAIKSQWEIEPIILFIVSGLEILGFFILPDNDNPEAKSLNQNTQTQNVSVNLNVPMESDIPNLPTNSANLRNSLIESKKTKVRVLFIDDDQKFSVVKILKDSGWKNTKTVVDIKSLDIKPVQDADILFVDINGVGKLLHLEYEGLDLALMLKQKYPNKKVVIYSAKKNSNSFHPAWDVIDTKLEKNALPFQFQNLVEEYSLDLYN